MSKKALLVGCNYTSIPSIRLQGCINDVININEVLTAAFDYNINNITILRDDNNVASLMPTRANILNNLQNLVNQSANLKEIWFHYSGHGSQVRDANGDEADGLDEVLVPIDYQRAGLITDDEIFNIVKNSKCKTILLFDSCHSATMCDLQWYFQYQNGSVVKSLNVNKAITNTNVFCFSGCKDNQTSADAYSNFQKRGVGAFTDAFIHALKVNNFNVNILKLYTDLCVYIQSQGFTQSPAFSASSVNPYHIFMRETNSAVSNETVRVVDAPVVVRPAPFAAPVIKPVTAPVVKPPTPIKKDFSLFNSFDSNAAATLLPPQEPNLLFSFTKYNSKGLLRKMF
jgi:hypothetical protein